MKCRSLLLSVLILLIIVSQLNAEPPEFKKKIYFGPIPVNSVSASVGFLDGPSAQYLTDHLAEWAKLRNGQDVFDEFSNSPFLRIGYERQVAPDYAFRFSFTFAYLKTSSYGNYVAQGDSLFTLDIRRTFKVYLLSIEGGMMYYFIEPKPQSFSPYVGGGMAAVFPLARLTTDSYFEGQPFSNPGEDVSRNSFEAGAHMEFGMVYYITNRYAGAIEGRYQISQSKFYIHEGNFDISYNGFSLALNFYYYF